MWLRRYLGGGTPPWEMDAGGAEVASVMVASEGGVHLRIRTSPLTMASEGGVQNRGKLWNGRHWDAEVASRMAGRWEMDARGMLVWRPKREGRGNRTPGGRECGVQNGRKLWNGRQGETAVASESAKLKIPDAAWRCKWRPTLLQSKKTDATGKYKWRP